MKTSNFISKIALGFAMLAAACCLSSCDFGFGDTDTVGDDLSILPNVSGGRITKAVGDEVDGVEALNENAVETLDVFVEGVTDTKFWREYHLPSVNVTEISSEVNNLLSTNWKNEDLKAGDKYNIYVVANSPLTTQEKKFTGSGDLKSLVQYDYDPEEDNPYGDAKMPYWSDGTVNPEWLDLHKLYAQEMPTGISNPGRAFSTDKTFLMDGFVKEWTPDASKNSQIIPVEMNRAASKFMVNIKFDKDFIASIEKEGEEVTGMPGWRFYNFSFSAPVLDPAVHNSASNLGDFTPSILNAGALILGTAQYGAKEDDYAYTLNTYSYPFTWETSKALTDAPAVIVSMGYKNNNTGKTTYNYYRIPLVNQSETNSIGRNNIYVVNATIASKGSTLLAETVDIAVDYEVIPWNDENNSGNNKSTVKDNKSYYLAVSPNNVVLRGNGSQTATLVYKKPSKQNIGILYFPNQAAIDAEDYQFGQNYTNYIYTASSKVAYYYNASGTFTTTFQGNNVQAEIEDNSAESTITVNSTSMVNRAVKYIKFRVYLDVDNWESQKLYQDITIKHLPVDNIQNIEGLWSSRTDDGWVDWSKHAGETFSSTTAPYTYDGSHYQAKVYDNGLIYGINVSNNYTYTRYSIN